MKQTLEEIVATLIEVILACSPFCHMNRLDSVLDRNLMTGQLLIIGLSSTALLNPYCLIDWRHEIRGTQQ